MSEVMIREVKVVTTGYAPEFGQTMGLVYNAITPSGTNTFKGQAATACSASRWWRCRSSRRAERREAADRRQRLHVRSRRSDRAGQDPLLRRLRAHRARSVGPQRDHDHAGQPGALGLNEPAYMPRGLNTEFAIGKVDHQLSGGNRLSLRYMFFDNFITANVGGGRQRAQLGAAGHRFRRSPALDRRAADLDAWRRRCSTSCACSTRRAPRAGAPTRWRARVRRSTSPGVANLGGRWRRRRRGLRLHAERAAGQRQHHAAARRPRLQSSGLDLQWVADTRTSRAGALYTFPNTAAYLAARDGANRSATPRSRRFRPAGPRLQHTQTGFFVQDDWRVSADLKILYGVRYDLYGAAGRGSERAGRTSREFRSTRTTSRRGLARCGRSAKRSGRCCAPTPA